jgi:hypothetical protein
MDEPLSSLSGPETVTEQTVTDPELARDYTCIWVIRSIHDNALVARVAGALPVLATGVEQAETRRSHARLFTFTIGVGERMALGVAARVDVGTKVDVPAGIGIGVGEQLRTAAAPVAPMSGLRGLLDACATGVRGEHDREERSHGASHHGVPQRAAHPSASSSLPQLEV